MVASILFDYGSTLDGGEHWLDRYLGHYRANGIVLAREELDLAYAAGTRAGYQASATLVGANLTRLNWFLVGKQIEFLRSSQAPAHLRAQIEGLGLNDRTSLRVRIVEAMAEESTRAMAASRAVLERLAPRYKLGVVSNFYGNLELILEEAGMRAMFAAVVDSSRVGFFKPDPRIFTVALDAMKSAAAATAMVGDSLEKDIAPAGALGMRTAWYCPGESAQPYADSTFKIRALDELIQLEW